MNRRIILMDYAGGHVPHAGLRFSGSVAAAIAHAQILAGKNEL